MKTILVLTLFCAYGATLSNDVGSVNIENKIYGGEDAKPGQFPYVAFIQNVATDQYVCGAVIISRLILVSAASCYKDYNGTLLAVAGLITRGKPTKDVQKALVAEVSIHEDYKIDFNSFNIAYIYLSSSFAFNDAVNAVKLPKRGMEFSGTATFVGYGLTSLFPPTNASTLQYAELSIITNEECNEIFAELSYLYRYVIRKENNICALPTDSGSGCRGDIGGPLVQNGTLVGIGHYVPPDCGEYYFGIPNVFTRIYDYDN